MMMLFPQALWIWPLSTNGKRNTIAQVEYHGYSEKVLIRAFRGYFQQ